MMFITDNNKYFWFISQWNKTWIPRNHVLGLSRWVISKKSVQYLLRSMTWTLDKAHVVRQCEGCEIYLELLSLPQTRNNRTSFDNKVLNQVLWFNWNLNLAEMSSELKFSTFDPLLWFNQILEFWLD